ncbi:MAG: thioredoxin [Bacteroidetes bacterium]|uniref:Thioredoxin n=1 Tax=Candidatus Cryptobacteroides faecipullorum TaxID=2840764 RepID=A0A9D9I5P3_9BACT|nr:thioredoxin [Candidatus Cryptobacteroides faecipullorum]
MKTSKRTAAAIAAFAAGIISAFAGNDTGKVTVLTEEQYRISVEDFTTEEWEYLGEGPAIVDFYADWCGPCRRLAPIMEELAGKYDGKVRFYKVNVDNARKLSAAYGIRSIPSVLFIPAEREPQMNVGLMSEEEFSEKIEELL